MAGASSKPHLIPSQPPPPAERSTAPSKQETSKNPAELQQTIDQLLSQVNLPEIRSSAVDRKQDVDRPNNKRGTVRKLGQLVPNQAIQPTSVTVSGHRLVGPRNPLSTGGEQGLVLTVSRKTPFSVYLKRALAHLRKPKAGPLIFRAMGCAVSMALSLALAVESHLQIARPAILTKELSTGTVVVGDEVVPRSEMSLNLNSSIKLEIKLRSKLNCPSKSET
ncbi:hypothetical protein PSHT_07416 [Puccinia striiformis]|uniref:Uncharacterized protein n=1 Tax=Puccinia striiformis TaxID=27350 RepID=A0A2S4VXX4_9BASI|nr:hypothetical protein PSHT_07416 [Puccinia striiformis]